MSIGNRLRLILVLCSMTHALFGMSIPDPARAGSKKVKHDTQACPSKCIDQATSADTKDKEVSELSVGQTVNVVVWAHDPWNRLGVRVLAGQKFSLNVGENGSWCDSTLNVGPAGYTSDEAIGQGASSWVFNKFVEKLRRMRTANWFALVCGVDDEPSTYHIIGTDSEWSVPATGTLGCFANDLSSHYYNNSGSITLGITRLR